MIYNPNIIHLSLEYPVNGVRKSKLGCSRTKKMRNAMRNTKRNVTELKRIGDRLKTKQVSPGNPLPNLPNYPNLCSILTLSFSLPENDRNGKLDTLPEEKIVTTTTTSPTTTSTNTANHSRELQRERDHPQSGNYQRVYADWKPSSTLEKTDVVGNIQAIAEEATKSAVTQPHLTTAEELRQYRRQRSHDQGQSSNVLHSIAEEDARRKSIISKLNENDGKDDCLKIYMRRPSCIDQTTDPLRNVVVKSPSPQSPAVKSPTQDDTFTSLLDHHKSHNESQFTAGSSKEIDADNIETPPVTRRVIATPNTTVITVNLTEKPKPEEKSSSSTTVTSLADLDGPVAFDRHSVGRRTRRTYKRPPDYSSGNEELVAPSQEIKQSASASELRRQQKQDEQHQQPDKARNITKLEKVGRHISSINQEDVREAIRNLKSPTGTPERPWSPPRDLTPSKLKLTASGHELNDEGFEETQSLVSDTPSHGKGESTNSSCNEANDAPTQRSRPLSKQKTSTTSISSMGSRLADRLQQARMRGSSTSAAPAGNKSQNQIQTPSSTNKRSISASRPMRMPNGSPMLSASPTPQNVRSSSASGVRREPAQYAPSYAMSAPKQRDVERSSSRNSLRSSKSSINSGASTQTVVRRLPSVQRPAAAVSVDSSPSKRPLAAQNTRPTSGRGVPASRSSSSGSSVGPSVILVRSKLTSGPHIAKPQSQSQSQSQTLASSTSFKENQSGSMAPAASRMSAARSAVLVKNVMNQQQARSGANPQQQQQQQSRNRSVSSFMRPTASSATKRQK